MYIYRQEYIIYKLIIALNNLNDNSNSLCGTKMVVSYLDTFSKTFLTHVTRTLCALIIAIKEFSVCL